jgi:hypothetical protein
MVNLRTEILFGALLCPALLRLVFLMRFAPAMGDYRTAVSATYEGQINFCAISDGIDHCQVGVCAINDKQDATLVLVYAVKNLTGPLAVEAEPPFRRNEVETAVLEDEELFKQYGALKYFLEFNWGRVGLKLQHVKKPQDVSSAIQLVPRFEQLPAFRDYNALCFSNDATGPVRFSAVRKTKQMHEEANEAVSSRWTELHTSGQKFDSARNRLRIAVPELSGLASSLPVFISLFAMVFVVQQLQHQFENARLRLEEAQKYEGELGKRRAAQEAWFAQNEIVQMRRSKRRELSADNLAKAMAGMPEYGWFNSFRRCEDLDIHSFKHLRLLPPPYPYQLFEMVTHIVKRMKPLKIERVKKRLLGELRLEENTLLRETVKIHWLHMQRAFADCRGKRLTRHTLPYFLIGSFLDRMELGTSAFDTELAKHAEAELGVNPQAQ